MSAASTARLAAALTGAAVAEFAGAGSYHHIDAWEPFLERVDAFLAAHDGAPACRARPALRPLALAAIEQANGSVSFVRQSCRSAR